MGQAVRIEDFFVDGVWVPSTGQDHLEVFDPSVGRSRGVVRTASAGDVDQACAAAARAFPEWSSLHPDRRAAYVAAVGLGLAERAEELADAITAEVGTPRHKCVALQVNPAVAAFASAARLGAALQADERIDNTTVRRVPVGVVACITPWNYPLFQIASKIAAALVAGCTVVLKPSEVAPSCVVHLVEAASALPPGVLNVVFGGGPGTGETLVRHPSVDFVSFTGSTRAGRRIAAVAGEQIKQVSLELGGKSASIVLPGADLTTAITKTLSKTFQNSGQTCAALTRLLLPRTDLAEARAVLNRLVPTFTTGHPTDPTTELGPVTTAAQHEKILTLTSDARGLDLIASGPTTGTPPGYYVPAQAYLTDPNDPLAQEEIFGPVLAVIPYDSISEATDIANNSPYGLSGSVWGATPEQAAAVATQIRTGSISINGAPTHPDAPFGGFRMSGFGRERGAHGILEFLTTQSVHF